jgi:hypothetical protein
VREDRLPVLFLEDDENTENIVDLLFSFVGESVLELSSDASRALEELIVIPLSIQRKKKRG